MPKQNLVSCGPLWMNGSISNRAWTHDSPGMYTCRTCFNARRPCFVWQDEGARWVVLPLPPQLRSSDTTWREKEYYVFGGVQHVATSFSRLWEGSYETKRTREVKTAREGTESGSVLGAGDGVEMWDEDMPGWAIT